MNDRVMVLRSKAEAISNLMGMEFTTAYIDGDHWGDAPLNDWKRVKDIVTKYVVFDNWDEQYPKVRQACEIANKNSEWICVYKQGISYVVERIKDV